MSDITAAHLTADLVILAVEQDIPYVLLVWRASDSDAYPDSPALPGGYLNSGEDFADAARREASEETGVAVDQVERIDVYGTPGRDPRGRVVSVAHLIVIPERRKATAGDDARAVEWVPVSEALTWNLAFDHNQILADAVAQAGDRMLALR